MLTLHVSVEEGVGQTSWLVFVVFIDSRMCFGYFIFLAYRCYLKSVLPFFLN